MLNPSLLRPKPILACALFRLDLALFLSCTTVRTMTCATDTLRSSSRETCSQGKSFPFALTLCQTSGNLVHKPSIICVYIARQFSRLHFCAFESILGICAAMLAVLCGPNPSGYVPTSEICIHLYGYRQTPLPFLTHLRYIRTMFSSHCIPRTDVDPLRLVSGAMHIAKTIASSTIAFTAI